MLIDRLASLQENQWRYVVREMSAMYRSAATRKRLPPIETWQTLKRAVNRARIAKAKADAVLERDLAAEKAERRRSYMRGYMADRRAAGSQADVR